MIISTAPSSDIPIWPVLQPGKNEWCLTVRKCNLNSAAPSTMAPIFNTQYYWNYWLHPLGNYFAIIDLDNIFCSVSTSIPFQLLFGFTSERIHTPLLGYSWGTSVALPSHERSIWNFSKGLGTSPVSLPRRGWLSLLGEVHFRLVCLCASVDQTARW